MRPSISVIVLTLSVAAGLATAADWPRYRGPAGDGVAEDAKLEKLTITQVWKNPVGDAFGQIAVVGEKALLMAERGADEFCVCLNAATGKEIWATRIDKSIKDGNGNGPRSTPNIDGKMVYVLGTNLKVSCLDLETGKEVWKHDLVAEHGAKVQMWGSASSPVVIDDLVLVTGGGAGKGISAFKKDTGALAWAKTNETQTHATPTVAKIKDKVQAICLMKSGLVSVDPANGNVLWTLPIAKAGSAGAVAPSPIVGGKDGDIVYWSIGYSVGSGACKVAQNGGKWTATELWNTPGNALQTTWSTAVYRDGFVYGLFGHADNNGPLACVDILTGKVKWNKAGFGSQGGVALSGDKLLVQTVKGELVLVSATPDAFKELDRKTILKAKDWTAPTLANGMIFSRNTSAQQGGNAAEIVCFKVGG